MIFDRVLVGVLLFGMIAGATTPLHAQPYERTVRDTVSLTPGSVSVENEEGSITVSTWDRDAVAYHVRIVSGQSKNFADETSIEVENFNQKLSLTSNFEELDPEWSFGPDVYGYGVSTPEVHYTLTLPKTAELTVEDEESEIEIDGLNAALQVETTEGSVEVKDQQGTTRIDAHEGSLAVTDIQGDLKVDTHEGSATVEGLRGDLLLDTHEGQAEVNIDSLASVDVDTHEGRVELTMPRDAGFDLSTEINEDASFRSTFSLDAIRNEGGNYHGAVQGGGPLVHLRSQEGQIVLNAR